MSTTNDNELKLEKHLKLLKEEYTKLQRNYNDLERKYGRAVAASGGDADQSGEFSSFVSRLAMTVATLYGRKTYSDISVRLADKTMPAHKFVLNARSEEWREEILAESSELDWSDLEQDIGYALLRWLYTDVIDLQHDTLALGLLRAAHRFKLPGLLGLCERALVASVGVRSCVRFYCVAEEVSASSLLEYCSGLISSHWDDLTPQDFEHMSGTLLYKMLKNKTTHPLHFAVRLLREDVVFICLLENSSSLEIVNSLSTQGQLPLGMALLGRSAAIAQTLIETGKADVDAYTGDGCTLLIDAIKRGDAFSANFLLEHKCNANLADRNSNDTALHLIATYAENTTDSSTYADMLAVARRLIDEHRADANLQNDKGYTPLHLAIVSGHTELVAMLLDSGRHPDVHRLDVNLRTADDKCALHFALMPPYTDGPPFRLAERLLTEHGSRGAQQPIGDGRDSLLQLLAHGGHEDAACFLVAHVTNPNHLNRRGLTALHIACEAGCDRLVARLLEAGASPNLQSGLTELKSALHFAVQSKRSQAVLEAIVAHQASVGEGEKIDFNLKSSDGESPLSLALSLGHNTLVPLLMRGGADVNARNGQDLTLLHQAILKEDAETAVFLLTQGADMDALTGDQESPLQLAIHCRLPTVVDALCNAGVSFGTPPDNRGGDPPLWSALAADLADIAAVLVKHGVDTDCWSSGPDGCQQTLLHRAIDENNETAAVFLVRSGCDVDSPRQPGPNGSGGSESRDKATPLHLVAQWGLIAIMTALIEHGANVNAIDCDGKTPLHIAIENQHEDAIGLLLMHPTVDLRVRDRPGNTPFAAALTVRNHRAARDILKRLPTAAEQMDQRGRNFLHVAIMKDDLESVLFLLAIQVDVNSRVHDVSQTPPLHLAAACKTDLIVRNLILAGARVNDHDATGRRALHVAAERGNAPVVSALLQNAADYDAVDSDQNNALHIAVRAGHLPVVRELLTESGVNAEAVNLKGRNPLHELAQSGRDATAASIAELFLESMPQYPINVADIGGNTALLLAYQRAQAPLCRVLVRNGACLGTENNEGVTMFNYKLATNQLLHNLLDQLAKESPWSQSDSCQECGTRFSLTMRKHHCRHCGRVLCNKCSNNEMPIVKFGIMKPTRVCAVCFDVLQVGGSANGSST